MMAPSGSATRSQAALASSRLQGSFGVARGAHDGGEERGRVHARGAHDGGEERGRVHVCGARNGGEERGRVHVCGARNGGEEQGRVHVTRAPERRAGRATAGRSGGAYT
ncbi:hypothetical protein C8R43DRAFT_1121295 [Mycena crocata]|nr:hypothetical protein C8R43DRAFT_1121295 [Mycena crocata]